MTVAPTDLELTALDEALTVRLLEVAVAGVTPFESMPPVEGPPGWTPSTREAFLDFHRERNTGLDGAHATVMYAISVGGAVVGMIRMSRREDEPTTMETGIWLARSARGRGLAVAALRALVGNARAAGAKAVVADTTPANGAALAALRRCGAVLRPDGDKVYARMEIV